MYLTFGVFFNFLNKFYLRLFSFHEEFSSYKSTYVVMPSAEYFCPVLTELEFSRQVWMSVPNIKFHENPPSGSRVVSCGRTDGPTWRIYYWYFGTARTRLRNVCSVKDLRLTWESSSWRFKFSGKWHCVVGWVVSDLLEVRAAFIL
jgi:hypothetical protein